MENFALAVQALVVERDTQFLMRISKDYNLSFEELKTKYVETAAQAIKIPRKYTKATVATEGKAHKAPKTTPEKQCCTSQTSKKEPCKFAALKGEVFCKRHLKSITGDTHKTKVPKVAPPVHTHEITSTADPTCDLCQSHGNPLADPDEFEIVATPAERLAKMIEEADDDDDDDVVVSDTIGEEEYED